MRTHEAGFKQNGNSTISNETQPELPYQEMTGIYKAEQFLKKYGFIFVVPIGYVGNSLSLLVMLQKQNRVIPSNLYIAFLAISDNIALSVKMVFSLGYSYTGSWTRYNCNVGMFLIDAALMMSAWLIVCLTFDRYIAVAHPYKMNTYCTRKRTCLMSLFILFIVMALKSINITHFDVIFGVCLTTMVPGTHFSNWHITSTILFNIGLPFVTILGLNVGIGIKLNKSRVTLDKHNQNHNHNQSNSGSKRQTQLTRMLLTISFVFLILNLPVYIAYITFEFIDDPASNFKFRGAIEFLYLVALTNNAINFVFYVIAGPKFRDDLFRIFKSYKCINRVHPETTESPTLD